MDTEGMGGWADSYTNNEYYREYIDSYHNYYDNYVNNNYESYYDAYRNSTSWEESYGPGYYNYYYDTTDTYQFGLVWDPYGGYYGDNIAEDPYYGMENYKTYFD